MSDLKDFVLDFYRVNGALVEPPRFGVTEVLLPDALAESLDAPALQEIVFDEAEAGVEDDHLHLAPGHPLVERIVEQTRRRRHRSISTMYACTSAACSMPRGRRSRSPMPVWRCCRARSSGPCCATIWS